MRTETFVYFDGQCSLPFFFDSNKNEKISIHFSETYRCIRAKKLEVSQFIKYKLKKYLLTCPEFAAPLT
jgi:hypothetical protein